MQKNYGYQMEKLSNARRALMVPANIAGALHEVAMGLDDLDTGSLPDEIRGDAETALRLRTTDGLEDPDDRGLWTVRADSFTIDDQIELS